MDIKNKYRKIRNIITRLSDYHKKINEDLKFVIKQIEEAKISLYLEESEDNKLKLEFLIDEKNQLIRKIDKIDKMIEKYYDIIEDYKKQYPKIEIEYHDEELNYNNNNNLKKEKELNNNSFRYRGHSYTIPKQPKNYSEDYENIFVDRNRENQYVSEFFGEEVDVPTSTGDIKKIYKPKGFEESIVPQDYKLYHRKIEDVKKEPGKLNEQKKQLKERNSMYKKIQMLKKANYLDKQGKVKQADLLEKKAQNSNKWLEEQRAKNMIKHILEQERNKEVNERIFKKGTQKYGLPPSLDMLEKQFEYSMKNTPEGIQFGDKYRQQMNEARKRKEIANKTYYFHDTNRTWWDRLQLLLDPMSYAYRTLHEYK